MDTAEKKGSRRFLIHTDEEKCVGCNRCMRVCPIETANIAYEDAEGSIKVKIDPDQCILCGACVNICAHSARSISDDTERFFRDLLAGTNISVITAPSIRTNIPEWPRLFTLLRQLGVSFIYDVSLGADLCIWAHLRYLERHPEPIITQPCPVVVSYCEQHRHDLLPRLSPVHSPMGCAAIYMRGRGITGPIASLSPCVAKTAEHESTGLIQYNITFTRLLDYLERNHITLPEEPGGFDHDEAGPGTLFPLPGGLKENLKLLSSRDIHVEKAEGGNVFRYLDQYAETAPEYLPDVYDVLNCADGCLIGTGCSQEQNVFKLGKQMNAVRSHAAEKIAKSRERLREYDGRFRPEDFFREYTPIPHKYGTVSEEQINQAFLLMNKTDFTKRNFNCGACGSDSCRDMARKIVLGVNMPGNCVIMAHDEAKQARERNAEYLSLVRNIGDELFSTQDEYYPAEVQESLRVLSETVHCAAVAIWRRVGDEASSACERVYGWYGDNPSRIAILGDWPETWVNRLKQGERLLVNSKESYPDLFSDDVVTLFIVPIHIRGQFWGFVDAIDIEDRVFSKEEASLLEAAGILLITGILERELNNSLVSAREEALSGTRAKSDFLSRMSHEMRTPMNAIIGMTHMGKTAADLDRKDYCLDKIQGASSHLLGVINDILDMSKIEADRFELSNVAFDFEKMLQNVVNVINFRVEEKQQIFTIHLDSQIPARLEGDDQRLAQVITNLLSNAVKFTPERGAIRLAAQLMEETAEDCMLRIEVADTGIGISEEQQKRLFRSFEQADSGTSRRYGGTGLGLAISKRIVEMMGGKIWTQSEPGEGSSFYFTCRMGLADVPETPLAEQPDLSGLRILAVDDAPEIREFFRETAVRFGVRCDIAANAAEALALMEQNGEYPLYFVDYRMPGMNGIALCREIQMRQQGECHLVLISGADRSDISEPAKEAGIHRILSKPLFPSDIFDVIGESQGRGRIMAESGEADDDLSDLAGYRMLLAEDIEINREIVLSLLEPSGMKIDCAENGLAALEMFREAPEEDGYDVILMDMQMPEMDGCEATRQIRALGTHRAGEVAIIAMTANVFREDVDRCIESGMNDHLGKPIDYDDLIAKLRRYLPPDTERRDAR